jgi:hypothetical protein
VFDIRCKFAVVLFLYRFRPSVSALSHNAASPDPERIMVIIPRVSNCILVRRLGH